MSAPSTNIVTDEYGRVAIETLRFSDSSSVQIINAYGTGIVTSRIAVTTANGTATTMTVTGTAQPDVQVAGSYQSITGMQRAAPPS